MPKSVVLLHGVSSTRTTWWRMEQDLADLGWTVHALNLLGHGDRGCGGRAFTLDDLATDVIDQLAERGFGEEAVDVVIGHSLGAVVALAVAAREPEYATRIVLEDPPGLTARSSTMVADMIEAGFATAAPDPDAAIEKIVRENPAWARQDAENSVHNLIQTDVVAVTAFLRSGSWDLAGLVDACPIPLTLLAATEPWTALSDPVREKVFQQLGPDRVSVIESGHSIHRDRPGLWLLAALADPALA